MKNLLKLKIYYMKLEMNLKKQKMILIKKNIDELEKIQEKFNQQSTKIKKIESELNKKK